jgi:hypothetical protein
MSTYQASGSYLEWQELFLAFAKWLRAGGSNNGQPISGMQVETMLQECAMILLSLGHKDPHQATLSQEKLDPTISKLIWQYKEVDPSPVQQMALPTLVFHWLTEKCSMAQIQL